MNVIVIDEGDLGRVATANAALKRQPTDIPARALIPRRLKDGRLILNADVLGDPFFGDAARGWKGALVAGVAMVMGEEELKDEG